VTQVTVNGVRYEWVGELQESTRVTIWRGRTRVATVPFEQLLTQTGGQILDDFERAGVTE
jgi:hypothetical protein